MFACSKHIFADQVAEVPCVPDLLVIRCPDQYPDEDLDSISDHPFFRRHLGIHNQSVLVMVIAS